MFDVISYILGKQQGGKNVTIQSDMTFTDDGEGNITITTSDEEGE